MKINFKFLPILFLVLQFHPTFGYFVLLSKYINVIFSRWHKTLSYSLQNADVEIPWIINASNLYMTKSKHLNFHR